MARATYRFQLMADRSDGVRVPVQDSAAVYDSPEEALLQAGTDEYLGANVHPLDVIDGEEHGYDRPASEGTGKVLAGRQIIARAARVVRTYWVSDERINGLQAAGPVPITVPDPKGRPKDVSPGAWAAMGQHQATVDATLRELRDLLA